MRALENKAETLDGRMKGYENEWRATLPRHLPIIVRVDGRAFHTLTRGMQKPWDERLVEAMTEAAKALVAEAQGCAVAYVQSDEISLLLTAYTNERSEPWFGGSLQKIASISASIASVAFNKLRVPGDGHFDGRTFSLPADEVVNYFIWRQQDAIRNSKMGLAQTAFSQRELHKLSADQAIEKLRVEKKIDWSALQVWQQRGWCVERQLVTKPALIPGGTGGETCIRTVVEVDWAPPLFVAERDYIVRRLPAGEESR